VKSLRFGAKDVFLQDKFEFC